MAPLPLLISNAYIVLFILNSLIVSSTLAQAPCPNYTYLQGAQADCAAWYQKITTSQPGAIPVNGIYQIQPGAGGVVFPVYCDMQSDPSGQWAVIQRRTGPTLDFYKTWNDYKIGFGDLNGDHWLGNQYINLFTDNSILTYKLRIELTDLQDNVCYAEYRVFEIGTETYNFKLYSLRTSYSGGTCGDSLTYNLDGAFSTYDRDNDQSSANCAQQFHGGWWYKNCTESNLNGQYGNTAGAGIVWKSGKGPLYSYKKTVMKMMKDGNRLVG